jgi:hypothetical protein
MVLLQVERTKSQHLTSHYISGVGGSNYNSLLEYKIILKMSNSIVQVKCQNLKMCESKKMK